MEGNQELDLKQKVKEEKKILREKIKNALYSMPREMAKSESEKCCSLIIESTDFKNADVVLCYMATEKEINADTICTETLRCGKLLALPKTVPGTRLMDFYIMDGGKNLDEQILIGGWHIREPIPTLPVFDAEKISGKKILAIIPGVAFTNDGARLGHGKGFYDIYLKKLLSQCEKSGCAITLTGLSFSTQILGTLPCSAHDVRMHKIIHV